MRTPGKKDIILTMLSLFVVLVLSGTVFFLETRENTAPEDASASFISVGGEMELNHENIFVTEYDGIKPYKGAPTCPTHDETEYHGIWNDEVGCHYDHTHGADPSKTIFADIVESWDQTISYPWQTPQENLMKHHGYTYIYDHTPDGKCLIETPPPASEGVNPNCITDILYIVHSMGTNFEMVGRFHSFRAVARVCNPERTQCGTVQTGGWADYGILECPYKVAHCPLPADPNPVSTNNNILMNQPPYRATVPLSQIARVLKSGINPQFWTNQLLNRVNAPFYPDPYNNLLGSSWASSDAWGGIDPANPTASYFICPEGDCLFNHSAFQIFTFALKNLPAGPFSGFTDKKGLISSTCTVESAECIPLVISSGVPAGTAWMIRQVRVGFEDVAPIHEYDICFNAVNVRTDCHTKGDITAGWIKPNMNGAAIPAEGFITPTTVVRDGEGKVLPHDSTMGH